MPPVPWTQPPDHPLRMNGLVQVASASGQNRDAARPDVKTVKEPYTLCSLASCEVDRSLTDRSSSSGSSVTHATVGAGGWRLKALTKQIEIVAALTLRVRFASPQRGHIGRSADVPADAARRASHRDAACTSCPEGLSGRFLLCSARNQERPFRLWHLPPLRRRRKASTAQNRLAACSQRWDVTE